MAQHTEKGSLIGLEGRTQSRTYQAKDGTNRTVIEIIAESVEFLSYKDNQNQNQTQQPPQNNQTPPQKQSTIMNKPLGGPVKVEISNDDLPW